MAYFDAADLAKYQAKITQQMQAGELRFRNPAVFNSIRRQTEMMIPSHQTIKNAAKRTTGEINFMNRTARSLGTGGEIYNHTGTPGTSGVLVPAWTCYDDKMKYSLKQANAGVFELDDMVMAEMTNAFINFAEGLETAAAAYLHANRSGVNVATVEGTFSAANDVFEIKEDLTNVLQTGYRAVQIMNSTMLLNKWSGAMSVYCDTIGYNKMQALAAQGAQNANNTSFQFQGMEFIISPELNALAVALGYTKGYFIVAPVGTLAVMDWIPEQNRAGIVTSVNKYGTLIDPNTGLSLASHTYEARADLQAAAGELQDVAVETQLFTYLSFNHAPLSTADATPLMAFGLVPSV